MITRPHNRPRSTNGIRQIGRGRQISTARSSGHIVRSKINVSQVFAGQTVGVKQVDDHLWLVTFMHYDLGYFDDETCSLEPIENPFRPKVLPMCSE